MIKVLLLTAVAIYGLLYAANPKKFLERRGDRRSPGDAPHRPDGGHPDHSGFRRGAGDDPDPGLKGDTMAWKDGRLRWAAPGEDHYDFVKSPRVSCLIECGDTKVLCCASVEDKTPPHVAEGEGWVTAEYSMLPRANRERSRRDIAQAEALRPQRGDPAAHRPQSLRAAVDLRSLGERTITIDCDVLQGDGGTRTASVTGGFIALAPGLPEAGGGRELLRRPPSSTSVTAVSAGIVDDVPAAGSANTARTARPRWTSTAS